MAYQALFDTPAPAAPPAAPAAPAPVVEPVAPQPDLFADKLSGIKDVDGNPKYDSVPKALDALDNSQRHISTLENEAKAKDSEIGQLREQVAKHDAVEDVVSRLTANNEQVQATPQSTGLDQEAVQTLVQQALSAERTEGTKKNNLNSVYDILSEKFGDNARDAIAEKVQELGTTLDKLKTLASENPNLVLALFEGGKAPSSNPTSSTFNIPAGTPKPEGLTRPPKSLLSGASTKDQAAYMKQIQEDVYKKHGVVEIT